MGAAIAIVAIAKLHPASLLLWIAARAWGERGGPQARVLTASMVTGFAIVGASIAFGGIELWQEYATVVRAGAGLTSSTPGTSGRCRCSDRSPG